MHRFAILLLLAACSGVPAAPTPPGGDGACRTAADCVPATCCHATACVPRNAGPDCDDVMCTRECRPGTIDCGGGCECREGRCAARPAGEPAGLDTLR